MQRRSYLLASAGLVGLVGCLGGGGEPDDDAENGTNTSDGDSDTDPLPEADNETGSTGDGDPDQSDSGSEDERLRPPHTVHHWPLQERQDRRVKDVVGSGDGEASHTLSNVAGPWRAGYAERARAGMRGHVDVGYLEAVNHAASTRSLGILATVRPAEHTSDSAMTIFGAGGGETNWVEFRLNDSNGDRSGRPMLFIRDDYGNTISAAANRTVPVDATRRLAVGLSGESAAAIDFYIDGEPITSEVVTDDGLTGPVEPEQSYGLLASNPITPRTIGTRRWFVGVLDDVIVTDAPVTEGMAEHDFARTRAVIEGDR